MKIIYYFIADIVAIIIAAWILVLQSDKKGKLLMILIVFWAVISAYKDLCDFKISRPSPILILDKIEEHYDRKPPNAVIFFIKIKNTGNAKAANVSTNPIVYLDGEILYKETTKQEDIDSGQVVKLRIRFQGDTFKKIWNEDSQLKLNLRISYSDNSGKKYSTDIIAKYKPYSHEPVLAPGWDIIKNR